MNRKLPLLLLSVAIASLPIMVLADAITLPNPLCPAGTGSSGCIDSIPALIAQITKYISTIIGYLAVLMFVIAGIIYVVSAGNPGRVQQATKTAIYAAVGFGIALVGAGLVEVIKAVIGAS